jgi:hypothetical protein
MSGCFILNVGAELFYTFDFSPDIASPATLASVTYTADSPLVTFGQLDDLTNKLSSIGVRGAAHGVTYTLQATGTTSIGEKIVRDITLQGFNA